MEELKKLEKGNNNLYVSHLTTMVELLSKESDKICKDNNCSEDEHNCESVAYFVRRKTEQEWYLDFIGIPDYWTGVSRERYFISTIYLPFHGSGDELLKQIKYNEEMEE